VVRIPPGDWGCCHPAPALNQPASPDFTAKCFPLARIHEQVVWDRIWRLLPARGRGLLPEASLERGEPLSWHHALRDMNATAGEVRPLRRMVSPVWRVSMPVSMRSENAVGVSPTWKESQNLPNISLITWFGVRLKGFAQAAGSELRHPVPPKLVRDRNESSVRPRRIGRSRSAGTTAAEPRPRCPAA
jgi:hypothetical protein